MGKEEDVDVTRAGPHTSAWGETVQRLQGSLIEVPWRESRAHVHLHNPKLATNK
jgi:hypothetical protein